MRILLALCLGLLLLQSYCHSLPCNTFECILFRRLEQQDEMKPVQVKRHRDYDFVRFGRSEPKKKASYDYIRFGKRDGAGPHEKEAAAAAAAASSPDMVNAKR